MVEANGPGRFHGRVADEGGGRGPPAGSGRTPVSPEDIWPLPGVAPAGWEHESWSGHSSWTPPAMATTPGDDLGPVPPSFPPGPLSRCWRDEGGGTPPSSERGFCEVHGWIPPTMQQPLTSAGVLHHHEQQQQRWYYLKGLDVKLVFTGLGDGTVSEEDIFGGTCSRSLDSHCRCAALETAGITVRPVRLCSRHRGGADFSILINSQSLKEKIFDSPTTEDFCCRSPFKVLNFLRHHSETCDGLIRTPDGGFFPIHRAVLAVVSPFFKSLFANPMASHPSTSISLKEGEPTPSFDVHVSKRYMGLVLDFIYTSACEITDSNVEYLIPLSERFQIEGLKQACCDYLEASLEPYNVLGVWKYAERHNLPDLKGKAKKYALDNFHRVTTESAEFGQLEFARLEELLFDDYLNARSEEMVFEAIVVWISYEPAKRKRFLLELMHTVRFGQMSYKFLTETVWLHPLVNDNDTCQAALYHPSVFLAEVESKLAFEIDLNEPVARPRIPNEVLFAVGGWSAGAPTNFIETYDCRADRWFLTVCEDAPPSSYHGLVSLDGKLYMAGGFDGNTHFSSLRCYDPATKQWTDKACMYYPRCYVSVCALEGQIYAVGGYDGRTRMRSVERYTPEYNQWELLAPMHRQRSDASSCAARGRIYVAGGFNGQEVLNSVEFYDPKTMEWTFIRPMSNPRSGVSLVCYRDMLYVLGGFNGFVRMSTAEKYDFDTGRWSEVAEMRTARSNFAAAILEDLIFVIGGFNGTTTISLVECYDITTNRWYEVSPMNINRSALSACVLGGMPNAKEFSYLSRAGVPSQIRIDR